MAAKAMPKRTILTPVAAFFHISERLLWKYVKAMAGVLMVIILVLYLVI